jgi:hypothetical protein
MPRPTVYKNTFVKGIALLTGGFDTPCKKHAGLLNHRFYYGDWRLS